MGLRLPVGISNIDLKIKISRRKEEIDIETYVKMVKESYRFGCSYFSGSKMMDKFFNEIGEYEEMVLRCTYPELGEIDIEEIEEFVLRDGVSPQEVLEEFGLEDREERMREVVEVLSGMDREEWERYFEECRRD